MKEEKQQHNKRNKKNMKNIPITTKLHPISKTHYHKITTITKNKYPITIKIHYKKHYITKKKNHYKKPHYKNPLKTLQKTLQKNYTHYRKKPALLQKPITKKPAPLPQVTPITEKKNYTRRT